MIVYLSFRVKQVKQVWQYMMANELWGNKNNNKMLTKLFFGEHLKFGGLLKIFLNREK